MYMPAQVANATQRPVDDSPGTYRVVVSVEGVDHSTLLALVSALHRRRVEVLTAHLTWPVEGHQTFEATINATSRQARTVEATLGNLVQVTDASVVRAAGVAVLDSMASL